MTQKPSFAVRTESRGGRIGEYVPLLVLVAMAAAMATAIILPMPSDGWVWMQYFMGVFFCQFAMLKLFHLKAFFSGFRKYDLIAQRVRVYAYIYPFLELALGLGYLSFTGTREVAAATVVLMGVSAVSVVVALRRGLDINCPCMGTILTVPLSTVTLTEDAAMGLMALAMLLGMPGR